MDNNSKRVWDEWRKPEDPNEWERITFKKYATNYEVPDKEETIKRIEQTKTVKLRAQVALVYLTGARVGEILQSRYNNKWKGLRKRHISFKWWPDKDSGEEIPVITVNTPNQKNKNKKYKRISITLDVPYIKKIWVFVKNYINRKSMSQVLFPYTQQWSRELLKKHSWFPNNHFLRGLRLSHLVMYHGFNEQELVEFAGWKDSRPAHWYISLRQIDMIKALRRRRW